MPFKPGAEHHNWKGDAAGYKARHSRVKHARGSASAQVCACGNQAAGWARIHGKPGTDPMDYEPKCDPCHRVYDRESYLGKMGPKSGMNCWNRVLDEDAVEDIRVRHAYWGERVIDLAREYGASRSAVSLVVHFRNWKHVRACEI